MYSFAIVSEEGMCAVAPSSPASISRCIFWPPLDPDQKWPSPNTLAGRSMITSNL